MPDMYVLECAWNYGEEHAEVATFSNEDPDYRPEEVIFTPGRPQGALMYQLHALFNAQCPSYGSNRRMVRLSKVAGQIRVVQRGMGKLHVLPATLQPICLFDDRGEPVHITTSTSVKD